MTRQGAPARLAPVVERPLTRGASTDPAAAGLAAHFANLAMRLAIHTRSPAIHRRVIAAEELAVFEHVTLVNFEQAAALTLSEEPVAAEMRNDREI
ncbi:hypothetical protein [Agromyces sp. Marseille-Q5079]|uniref:hypothetical protein n=1 Tax=Agromyces sp. Marseille-Q5079 TaxID=3439059 RepID=UPI003D9C9807